MSLLGAPQNAGHAIFGRIQSYPLNQAKVAAALKHATGRFVARQKKAAFEIFGLKRSGDFFSQPAAAVGYDDRAKAADQGGIVVTGVACVDDLVRVKVGMGAQPEQRISLRNALRHDIEETAVHKGIVTAHAVVRESFFD